MKTSGRLLAALAAVSLTAHALAGTSVSVPTEPTATAGAYVVAHVRVDMGGQPFESLDAMLRFDDARLHLIGVYPTAFSSAFGIEHNAYDDTGDGLADRLDTALFAAYPPTPTGPRDALWVLFEVQAPEIASPVAFVPPPETELNGVAPDALSDGLVVPSASDVVFRLPHDAAGAPVGPASEVDVPIIVDPVDFGGGLKSFDVVLDYNPARVLVVSTATTPATAGFTLTTNIDNVAGRLIMSLFREIPAAGTGAKPVATVRFRVVGAPQAPLDLVAGDTDDGVTTALDDGLVRICEDADLDGVPSCGGDCDDADPSNFPGNAETCDGRDNDCDGTADQQGDALCDDAQLCNGSETCAGAGGCLAGTPPSCADADLCTDDTCVPEAAGGHGACEQAPRCRITGFVYYTKVVAGPADELDVAKPIAGAMVSMTGPAGGTATTDTAGAYAFDPAAGIETLAPQPRAASSDDLYFNALSSQDAAEIAKVSVLLTSFSPHQATLGDVSGNGRLTAYDAALVSRKIVLREAEVFPVAAATGSDWAWFPASDTIDMTAGGDRARDFGAGLWGDVTNSWVAPPTAAVGAVAPTATVGAVALAGTQPVTPAGRLRTGPATLYLASGPRPVPGGRWTVTLGIRDADGISALDLRLGHAAGAVAVERVEPVGLAKGLSREFNDTDGTCRIALFGAVPIAGSGPFLSVTYTVHERADATEFSVAADANEGAIPVVWNAATRFPVH